MKTAALPSSPLGKRLAEIFEYGWKWIYMPLDELFNGGEWKTNNKWKLKPRTLWKYYQDAATVIGCRFGSLTKYGMIDIDAGSPYLEKVPDILAGLETVGIVRTVIVRSSFSGGIHIYCPFPHPYKTFSIACLLQSALEAQGIRIAPGECEIFPNQKEYGKSWLNQFTEYNGHRLPLQAGTGSCILDTDLNPIEGAYDLSRFMALWDNAVLLNSHGEILEAMGIARANRRNRRRATGPVEDWRQDLLSIIEEGWTGHGQTNALLKDIATYGRVFLRLGEWELTDYVIDTATSLPGYEQYCGHHHDIHKRALAWSRAVEHFYWPLGTAPLRDRTLKGINDQRASDARERIARAYRLIADSAAGKTVKELVKLLCVAASTSASTLYKNLDLWHPEKRVTDAIPGDTATIHQLRELVKQSLETPVPPTVTHLGGENEGCSLETLPLKIFTPGGEEGGVGGEEGFPQPQPCGKPLVTEWPPLEWQEGGLSDG